VRYCGNYIYELTLGYYVAWYLGIARPDGKKMRIYIKFNAAYNMVDRYLGQKAYFPAPRDEIDEKLTGAGGVDVTQFIPFRIWLGPKGISIYNQLTKAYLYAFKDIFDVRWYLNTQDMARLINYLSYNSLASY
jgi:hypothetical protein